MFQEVSSLFLIAENRALVIPGIGGSFTSGGYNLFQNTSGVTVFDSSHMHSTDVSGVPSSNLHIDPMQRSNGGPTQTHALLPGSLAIDANPLADCLLSMAASLPQISVASIGHKEQNVTSGPMSIGHDLPLNDSAWGKYLHYFSSSDGLLVLFSHSRKAG